MANIFCIYVFSDEDCLPIYVGKAKNFDKRASQHINVDRFKYDTWFYRWLNKCIAEGRGYYIDILEEVNQENWQERERYWIKHVKENGYRLTNMTDGGDGNNNQVFSKEALEKRSQKLKGIPRPQEVRDRISKSNTGKKLSEETKRKLSEFNKGKPCPDIVKQKLSKPINQYDLEGNFIQEFSSFKKAADFLDCRKSSLCNAVKRNRDGKFKEFLWKYKQ
jgi:group I intron endonuclease